jgi:hypothetical protein
MTRFKGRGSPLSRPRKDEAQRGGRPRNDEDAKTGGSARNETRHSKKIASVCS